MIVGYPASLSDCRGVTIHVEVLEFETVILPPKEPIEGIIRSGEYNFLVKYDRSNIHVSYGRDLNSLKGISGCGAWCLDRDGQWYLMGIMTEDKNLDQRFPGPYLMGTNISEILYLLDSLTPEDDREDNPGND